MLDKIFKFIERFVPAKYKWILNHDGFKRYFANTGWMFGGQMFSLLVSFFIGAWIARYLGPENYGIFNYAAAFVGIFGFIATLGVDGILSRDLVKNPEQENELMGTGFVLKVIGGILAFLAVIIANCLVSGNSLVHWLIFFYGLSYLVTTPYIISIYFQSKVQSKNNVKAQIYAALISAVFKIIFIFSGLGLIWLVIVYLFDSVWQIIILIYSYRRHGHKFSTWVYNKTLAWRLWHDSWPLMLSSAAAYIYLRIGQVMIGRMLGNIEVGLYAAAVKITEVWYFVPGIICGSLFPAIINAKKTSEILYRRRLKSLYWFITLIALVIALLISLLAKPIIVVLFGAEYLLAVPILQIYVWSGVGFFLGLAISQYLMAENLVKTIFIVNFISMVVNVGLNFILIPRLGLNGAAWATLVSYLIIPILVLSAKNFFIKYVR